MHAKIRFSDFRLKGDSIAVPSLSVDDIQIELTFLATIVLSFHALKKTWCFENPSGEDFEIKIIDFDGPFGLGSVASMMLSLVIPILKTEVIKMLPAELGNEYLNILYTTLMCCYEISLFK